MKKRTLIRALLSIILTVYLVFALSMTDSSFDNAKCAGVTIEVVDANNCDFVTADGIDKELGDVRAKCVGMPFSKINTKKWEDHLSKVDDIEESNCTRMSDGTILIRVSPMRPVARFFNPNGSSFYINKDGKTMNASLRYRLDVPIIINECDTNFQPATIVPLLDRISKDSLWNTMVSAYQITKNGDILLIPSITGHVINFGDTATADDKFDRLMVMYKKVLPLKGWQYYDTISVKWNGQVVATRREKPVKADTTVIDVSDEEAEQINPMSEVNPVDQNAKKPKI